jgi:hypothetical protein
MKDFYDVLFFAEHYEFKKDLLHKALLSTFNHRSTDIKAKTTIFDDKFKFNTHLQNMWSAFLERTRLDSNDTFQDVVTKLQSFLEPIFDEGTKDNWNPKKWDWE